MRGKQQTLTKAQLHFLLKYCLNKILPQSTMIGHEDEPSFQELQESAIFLTEFNSWSSLLGVFSLGGQIKILRGPSRAEYSYLIFQS